MSIKEFSYHHADRVINPRHVESMVEFYRSGAVSRDQYGVGVEIEHIPVRANTGEAVTFSETNGIRDLLEQLAPLYDAGKEYREDGYVMGLGKGKIAVSLEPGGQVECSLGILDNPAELNDVYAQFRADIDPILERLDIRLINYGYQPQTKMQNITIIPKKRYAAMNEYLGRVSGYGWNMMRCSGSTQISIDFSSESDAIAKMRMGCAVGPILNYFFRNTPYFEGADNPYPLLRQRMWDNIASGRTGVNPGLFDSNYGFEQAAIDVLSTPLMVADRTHTPEALELVAQGLLADRDLVTTEAMRNAAEVYPDRPLNSYEINHVISTHFTDVRLKNFVELRHWDSLPIERARILTDIVVKLFTDESEFNRLLGYFDGITSLDVEEAKLNLQVYAQDAKPFGQSLEFWREFLHAEYTGEDIPGDPAHPEVFQR